MHVRSCLCADAFVLWPLRQLKVSILVSPCRQCLQSPAMDLRAESRKWSCSTLVAGQSLLGGQVQPSTPVHMTKAWIHHICIYIYIHICIVYTYTYICAYTYTYIHAYKTIYTHYHIFFDMYMYMYICSLHMFSLYHHTQTCTHVKCVCYKNIRDIYIYTYMYMHIEILDITFPRSCSA